jgi:hypothetical protein
MAAAIPITGVAIIAISVGLAIALSSRAPAMLQPLGLSLTLTVMGGWSRPPSSNFSSDTGAAAN